MSTLAVFFVGVGVGEGLVVLAHLIGRRLGFDVADALDRIWERETKR